MIEIHLKSKTSSCKCPTCNLISNKYHGTYIRRVQDLPMLGKRVMLVITSYEYQCTNKSCPSKTIVETFDGL